MQVEERKRNSFGVLVMWSALCRELLELKEIYLGASQAPFSLVYLLMSVLISRLACSSNDVPTKPICNEDGSVLFSLSLSKPIKISNDFCGRVERGVPTLTPLPLPLGRETEYGATAWHISSQKHNSINSSTFPAGSLNTHNRTTKILTNVHSLQSHLSFFCKQKDAAGLKGWEQN